MPPAEIDEARAAVLREFRWIDGHSDVWRLAEDGATFATVVAGLAALAAGLQPTAIAGIETRGVLFGAPVARALDVGFHTIRKRDGLFAGAALDEQTEPDYRGRAHQLRARASLGGGGRVVLVDDWIETGHQAVGARRLVESAGAHWAGMAVIVDQTAGDHADGLAIRSLVSAAELPAWRGE